MKSIAVRLHAPHCRPERDPGALVYPEADDVPRHDGRGKEQRPGDRAGDLDLDGPRHRRPRRRAVGDRVGAGIAEADGGRAGEPARRRREAHARRQRPAGAGEGIGVGTDAPAGSRKFLVVEGSDRKTLLARGRKHEVGGYRGNDHETKRIGHGSRRSKPRFGFLDAVCAEEGPAALTDRSGTREDFLIREGYPIWAAFDPSFVRRNAARDSRQPMLNGLTRRKIKAQCPPPPGFSTERWPPPPQAASVRTRQA